MNKAIFYTILITFGFSQCTGNPGGPANESLIRPIAAHSIAPLPVRKPDSTRTYAAIKLEILEIRQNLAKRLVSPDSVGLIFTDLLLNRIIPYWYGTRWSFDGHTAVPREGTIACGYFVSTTLSDMGIPVNRYQLAQQTPLNEAQTLCIGQPVITIQDSTQNSVTQQIKSRIPDGLYFAGLEQSHVGFVLKRQDAVFFIHSNYLMSEGVVMEQAEYSQVFSAFPCVYLAPVTTNRELMRRWLSGEKVVVVGIYSHREVVL